jgi:hypothetical protein
VLVGLHVLVGLQGDSKQESGNPLTPAARDVEGIELARRAAGVPPFTRGVTSSMKVFFTTKPKVFRASSCRCWVTRSWDCAIRRHSDVIQSP